MPRHTDTVQVMNVNVRGGGSKTRISRLHYTAMVDALLAVIPATGEGILFTDLATAVEPLLPRDLFEGRSVSWYATTVKLDLEARGLIERVPDSRPQRLRRTSA